MGCGLLGSEGEATGTALDGDILFPPGAVIFVTAEVNPERKALYQLCWHLGASQGDIASLKGEDVDWQNGTVSFMRKKTGVPVVVHLGNDALNVLKDLPGDGVLFPYLSTVRAGDRPRSLGNAAVSLALKA